ncbi:choline/ethanolamine kinase family protein [Labrys monachus]|uniref:Thiamine kinase-like enzyme n=1 Tax=Labrys monachus TaxID=217067 RepID=A0ABU0FHR6_9HYPH|nr:choline/ethanolamine kinase family protein [Labrys monachus]MDQ0394153.1 thiamine kinase-like enzyme [Labrys monachus]
MPLPDLTTRLAALPLWSGPLEIEPLPGGLTNRNVLVRSGQGRFVARAAGDNAIHGIDRRAEQAATRAAAEAGLGPELVWAEADLMVLRHVEGRTLAATDLAEAATLRRTVALLRLAGTAMPRLYRGPVLDRRPLVLLDRYRRMLSERPNRWRGAVEACRPLLTRLAAGLAAIPPGFAHNDIHGGNLIDDGHRLWLVDWEYAGQGQPMADIASLANNALLSEEHAGEALAQWLGHGPDAGEREAFAAMRLAAALRDLLWGYAQDAFAAPPAEDLADYIAVNEQRVKTAAQRLQPRR